MADEPKTVIDDHVASLPDVMRQLMVEFSGNKDFNSRAKTKQRMKAVLDFVAADTSYPTASVHPKEPLGDFLGVNQWCAPNPAMGPLPMPRQGIGDYIHPADANNFVAIPGARPERENEDILGG